MKIATLVLRLLKRIIFQRLIGDVVPPAGKGKEEKEGRERRDKKQKNVTGDGTI